MENKGDSEFRKIILVAGIIVAALGALILWRGIFYMIPKTGLAHGGLFSLAGGVFLAIGLCMALVPIFKEKRRAKLKQLEEMLEEQEVP